VHTVVSSCDFLRGDGENDGAKGENGQRKERAARGRGVSGSLLVLGRSAALSAQRVTDRLLVVQPVTVRARAAAAKLIGWLGAPATFRDAHSV
jgi:hypothetical protein